MITEEKIGLLKGILTEYVVKELCIKNKISSEQALRFFMKSKTYELLIDSQSYLCYESQEYVFDMLESELAGDWESWLAI